jgi:hypothetical protein
MLEASEPVDGLSCSSWNLIGQLVSGDGSVPPVVW